MYRFHLLSLVHLPQSKTYLSCAFSQKNRKLAKMLTSLGHEVFFYGSEGSDVEEYCNSDKLHFIQTHTIDDIRNDYGEGDNRFELGYNWTVSDFKHDINSEIKPSTKKFYTNAVQHILKVKKPDDFLLCTQGRYHKPIADAVQLFLNCESGIGYRGTVNPSEIPYGMWSRSFESSYIQNFTYGSDAPYASLSGNYYDRVIPNYFDPDDVEFSDEKDDYFLFVGRMIKRKGIVTAYLATKATGDKLTLAGQGAYIDNRGHLVDNAPQEFDIPNDSNWEYIGYADVEKRKKLMAHAKAVFAPTEYLECFAGTHVEAMLSGTPVITTDFGVYPGTVPDNLVGKIGFRCNTLQDFVDAVQKVKKFTKGDYRFIRKYAERFLMDNVKYEFQKWFDDLHQVYLSTDGKTKGWGHVTV